MEKEELYICAHDTLLAKVGLWDAFVIEKARDRTGNATNTTSHEYQISHFNCFLTPDDTLTLRSLKYYGCRLYARLLETPRCADYT